MFYQSGDYEQILNDYGDTLAYRPNEIEENDSGYCFFTTVNSSNWNMISYLTHRTINREFYSTFFILLVSYALLCLVTALLITPSIRRLIAPIRTLNASMQKVSSGDFSCHSQISSNDEIGDLSRVFNKMVDSLNENIEKIIDHEVTRGKDEVQSDDRSDRLPLYL